MRPYGHQRHQAASLSAEAVGSAGAESLSRCSTICSTTGRRPTGRLLKECGCWAPAGRRNPTTCANFWRATRFPIAGWMWRRLDRDPEVRQRAGLAGARQSSSSRSFCSPMADAFRTRARRRSPSHIGLQTRAEAEFYDLVIIGGGPAGLAAAVYGASEGLKTVIDRARGAGRTGGTELPHRELSRISRRAQRLRPDAARGDAGAALRRGDSGAAGSRVSADRWSLPRSQAGRRQRAFVPTRW